MNEVKIVFSTSPYLVSKIIRWAIGSPTSHVFFTFDVCGKELMLEAGFSGVKFGDYAAYAKKHTIVAEYKLAKGEVGELYVSDALRYLDERYDFGGLLGGAWVLIGRWFHATWKNPLQSSKSMFCSEYVTTVLKDNKYPGMENLNPSEVTPKDLLQLLK